VMVGQPALAPLLRRPESEQLRQRINVIARLTPLEDTQVEAYIAHRLRVAGASAGPFSEAAIRCIAQASAGVPRNINTLCFNALITAYGAGRKTVEESDIHQVVEELSLDDDASQAADDGSGRGPAMAWGRPIRRAVVPLEGGRL